MYSIFHICTEVNKKAHTQLYPLAQHSSYKSQHKILNTAEASLMPDLICQIPLKYLQIPLKYLLYLSNTTQIPSNTTQIPPLSVKYHSNTTSVPSLYLIHFTSPIEQSIIHHTVHHQSLHTFRPLYSTWCVWSVSRCVCVCE